MDDAVLFACGGGACHVLTDYSIDNIPVEFVNPGEASDDADSPFSGPIASGRREAIGSRLQGVRVAFVFAILGGTSGTEMMMTTSEVAKSCGCKVVAIAGIPMEFEHERRTRALDSLDGVRALADRTLLMDVGTVLKLRKDANSEMKFDAFFRASAHALGFALRNLAHMIDGPFFSTFAEKIYTFSYVNDLDPAEAVQRALGATVFPTDPAYGKLIVTVSSGFGTAQLEQIFHTVVSNTGIIPDIVKRDDREDTKVLVFLPVRLTSPRASRS